MSPLEKMARIYHGSCVEGGEVEPFAGLVEDLPWDAWAFSRAALLAIREADHDMLEAVKPWPAHWGLFEDASNRQKAAYYVDQATVASQHREIIDAILNQEPRP